MTKKRIEEIISKLGMVDEPTEIPNDYISLIAFVDDLTLDNSEEYIKHLLVCIFSECE